jgi:hypothetical protein
VDERLMFGPKLELQTEISSEPGANSFRVADVVTNDGAAEQEFQMLYHCNFGRPLLETGSTLVAPVAQIAPFNDTAARGLSTYAEYGGPQPGFIEMVYNMRLLGDEQGRTVLMLRNKAKEQVKALADRIAAIQGTRKPTMDAKPQDRE